jgi:tetratricopeptide (TPR) repeat protein
MLKMLLKACGLLAFPLILAAQQKGDHAITGQLVCDAPMPFDQFRIVAASSAVRSEANQGTFASPSGHFRLGGLGDGAVELRVLNRAGVVIARRVVHPSAGRDIEIQLPGTPGASGAWAVSLYALQHKTPKAAKALWRKARANHREGRTADAEQCLVEALKLDSDFAAALEQLGLYAFARRDYAAASQYLQRAAGLDQANVRTQSHAAVAELLAGHDAEAEHLARKTLRLDPGDGRAHYVLGLALLRQSKNQAEALRNLDEAGPEFPRAAMIASQLRARAQHPKH